MKEIQKEVFTVTNIFKSNNVEELKKRFNHLLEEYINFCENRN